MHPTDQLYDVAIVGGGPAGLSAALLLGRCRRSVVLFDDARPRNMGAVATHGFLTRDGTEPEDLRHMGRREAKRYGAVLLEQRVTAVQARDGGFVVRAGELTVQSRKLLLASGLSDEVPGLAGLRPLYGHSVHQCPFCDGWEERDGQLACYGSGDGGASTALTLRNWSHDVMLFTDGGEAPSARQRATLQRHGIVLIETPIARLEGSDGRLQRVVLADGREVARTAMFLHAGQRAQSSFATQLGCRPAGDGGQIEAEPNGSTCVAGVYVAGDLVDVGPQLAIVAAGTGATAAHALVNELNREDYGENAATTAA